MGVSGRRQAFAGNSSASGAGGIGSPGPGGSAGVHDRHQTRTQSTSMSAG
jgi:hypothetical protein